MVTIKDIALRAGVSFSTVSKALLDSPLVRQSTKERVLAIAKEMGYVPNLAARSLVSRRTGVVGIVWPSVRREALSSLITGLHAELEQAGYRALISMSEVEAAVLTFRRLRADAVLMFGDRSMDAAGMEEAGLSRTPLLVYGAAGTAPYSTVDVNRGQAIRLAVNHLAGLGHRNIAYVGDPDAEDPMQAVKIEAFREEMRHRGFPLEESSVLRVDGLAFQDGYWAALEFLSRKTPPTAVITGAIDLARGVLRAARDRGIAVPRDLSVVSYDNLPEMETLDVPMTAVGASVGDIASAIIETLFELIQKPDAMKTVFLEPGLVVRRSTAPPME
ncbi:LacI family DNA-binding transcriptional regulator [Cohnella caldifontis]|uniref:LacI family DNA-binding transcriptional regulator n=1 Tax=Cohnella caldifontis TaxID=3027471 RepID=UPI0023EC0C4B|nr:LacI family DNA-binding transcriptional regulator [Cohnella sp. YIM B05605]